ncbi:MAG TPA: hypothetical protein VD997_13185 [Phycisphaerales bacterium]|nr:hypothetical protein [Phycisphaerales bacterium]
MKVLVVEDDLPKLRQITDLVRAELGDAEIAQRRSYQSGLEQIVETVPDLVLLDMTMPTFDVQDGAPGGRPRAYAGREILAEVVRMGIRTKVIIVTGFESFFAPGEGRITLPELKVLLEKQFAGTYIGTVYYSASEAGWRAELAGLIAKSRSLK